MGQTSPGRVRALGRSIRQSSSGDSFWSLIKTSEKLQAPGGCPWDRAQTVETLLPCLIEESWEVYEAIRRRHSWQELEDELGDLLYTVIFMAMRGEQDGKLSLQRMLKRTREKMIRRHPHVFGKGKARTAFEAYQSWQTIKRGERKKSRGPSKRFSRMLVEIWSYLLAGKTAEKAMGSLIRTGPKPQR